MQDRILATRIVSNQIGLPIMEKPWFLVTFSILSFCICMILSYPTLYIYFLSSRVGVQTVISEKSLISVLLMVSTIASYLYYYIAVSAVLAIACQTYYLPKVRLPDEVRLALGKEMVSSIIKRAATRTFLKSFAIFILIPFLIPHMFFVFKLMQYYDEFIFKQEAMKELLLVSFALSLCMLCFSIAVNAIFRPDKNWAYIAVVAVMISIVVIGLPQIRGSYLIPIQLLNIFLGILTAMSVIGAGRLLLMFNKKEVVFD